MLTIGDEMDQQKVTDLAKSFSLKCKQAVNDRLWVQKLSSPAMILIAFKIMEVVVKGNVGPDKRSWTNSS
jgi:hypothetical protein